MSTAQQAKCDFCGMAGDIPWVFPARDFNMLQGTPDGGPLISVGGWAACSGCRLSIDQGAWDNLWLRWLDQHPESHPTDETKQKALSLWSCFQAARTGVAERREA